MTLEDAVRKSGGNFDSVTKLWAYNRCKRAQLNHINTLLHLFDHGELVGPSGDLEFLSFETRKLDPAEYFWPIVDDGSDVKTDFY
jgi:hypothetical protein